MARTAMTLLALLLLAAPSASEDLMVYTANQGFLSRIYVLDMNNTVLRYFQYSYEHTFLDLEVIEGEVYALDWVTAAVYRVDLDTGVPELVVADFALDLVRGVAFDGTYFYLDETALHRYRIDGTYDSSASFDEVVMGSAWDGEYLWTMDGDGLISCFDISAWPTVAAVPDNDFAAPSASCRGLWFDGEHFWTAESIDGSLGWTYSFDHAGTVVGQWREPAFQGWAACVVRDPQQIFADGFESEDTSRWGGGHR